MENDNRIKKIQEMLKQMRYGNEELSLIKNTFAENLDLLKILRKFFLQLPLTESEANQLEEFKANLGLQRLLRKTFLPEIEGDEPLNQIIDLWMTINISDKDPETALLLIQARRLVIDYLDQQLSILEGSKNDELRLAELITQGAAAYIKFLARNTIIQHVEQQLTQLFLLAGLKEETPQETIERLHKNSNK